VCTEPLPTPTSYSRLAAHPYPRVLACPGLHAAWGGLEEERSAVLDLESAYSTTRSGRKKAPTKSGRGSLTRASAL